MDYDVLVIGGGTAGSNAARAAAAEGAKTAMVRLPQWWNLCIQRGCMPSKSLLAAAEEAHTARTAGALQGIETAGEVSVDLRGLLARKDVHVRRFEEALDESLSGEDFEIIEGKAAFTGEYSVSVETEEGARELTAKRFVIATGSAPFVPPVEGLADTPHFTSDDVMENKVAEAPARLIVLGGGPIGLELGTVFARAGSAVTIVEQKTLLSPFAPAFGEELTKALTARENMTVCAPASVTSVSKTQSGVRCTVERDGSRETLDADALLVATGRKPNTDGLNLAAAGLEAEGATLACDERTQTAREHIYAAGDVTKDMQILHVASEEGTVAGYNAACGFAERAVDYDKLSTSVVFTDPPIAHVGPMHRELSERDDIVTAEIRFPETGRAITMGVEHGLWQMSAERSSGRIVASTILGPRADDLIFSVFLARQLGASVGALAELYAYHPTLSEQFVNLVGDLRDQLKT